MEKRYSCLFAPIKLGNTEFRNRIFASPVSLPDFSNETGMTERQKAFYVERAKGGAASVSTGDGIVDYETGFMHPYKLQLDNPVIYPSLSDLAERIRALGAVPTVEFSHGGKFANVSNLIGSMKARNRAYGPDHEITASGEEILEMPQEMIEKIIAAYGKAAERVKKAGFGMILLHAGHGWLLQQFMSPRTNHRKDEFGGSFENRMRLTLEVIKKIREAVGDGFPVEFRMSGAEFTPGGYDIEYGVEIAKAVDGLVDLIHVSAGVHDDRFAFTITHPSMFREHGCNVYLAERIKKEVKTPVATIGGLTDPGMLADIIESGKADVVEMGRQLMADPYLPQKIAEGRENDIVHCMRCFTCMQQLREGKPMRCAANPKIGMEDFEIQKAADKKLVLVAGGGPAGLTAAEECAKAGHRVILFEASDFLGGLTRLEKDLPFKYDTYRFGLRNPAADVRLSTPLTPEIARSLEPDVIISAIGAEPAAAGIKGADGNNVFGACDISGKVNAGFSVAVVGGGLAGCEYAVFFAKEGMKVTVVSRSEEIAKTAPWPHKLHITELIERLKINVATGCKVTEITKDGVRTEDMSGKEGFIPCDCVFMAAGMKSKREESEALRDCAPVFIEIGDVVKPRNIAEAVREGFLAAAQISN